MCKTADTVTAQERKNKGMRYIDADKLSADLDVVARHTREERQYYAANILKWVVQEIKNAPTADVVPKSEVAEFVEKLMGATDKVICEAKAEVAQNKDLYYIEEGEPPVLIETSETRKLKAKEILSDLKKEIHDKAVYPNCHGVEPYISLKVFDAVINKLIGS